MPEHFTKNTVSATFWCLKCNRRTLHRVDDGRKGPCMICMDRLEEDSQRRKTEEKQPEQEGFKFGGL